MTSPAPHSDDDTYELIDDALAALAERHGTWLDDGLAVITLLASLIDQAERCLPELAASARLRFDLESPIADARWPYDA